MCDDKTGEVTHWLGLSCIADRSAKWWKTGSFLKLNIQLLRDPTVALLAVKNENGILKNTYTQTCTAIFPELYLY